MRILLTAKCPPNGKRKIGGVQSWCRTVGAELVERGHSVEFWGPGQKLDGLFDFGVLANWNVTRDAAKFCSRYVVVSHGIIEPEEPPEHCDIFFTSEGVRDHWKAEGLILRQPIDLDFWSPKGDSRRFLTRFSYRAGLNELSSIAEELGLEYQHIRNLSQERARDVLRESACVLATGRAALEAMACGAPVVIADHRSSYQRALLDPDTTGAMVRNYSGRGGVEPTRSTIIAAIKKAVNTGSLREHVERFHDAGVVVDELVGKGYHE